MIVTSEYIFLNPELNEKNDNLANTQQEFDRKYGHFYCRKIDVRCNIKLDKVEKKQKILRLSNIIYMEQIERWWHHKEDMK